MDLVVLVAVVDCADSDFALLEEFEWGHSYILLDSCLCFHLNSARKIHHRKLPHFQRMFCPSLILRIRHIRRNTPQSRITDPLFPLERTRILLHRIFCTGRNFVWAVCLCLAAQLFQWYPEDNMDIHCMNFHWLHSCCCIDIVRLGILLPLSCRPWTTGFRWDNNRGKR